MTQPFKQWTVLPHGNLSQVDDNLLTVTGNIQMPLMDLPRRMSVVRLQDGRLVIFSFIALDEDAMATLDAFGTPAFLIVPSDKHRLDAKVWKDRYPLLQVVTPQGAREKVEQVVHVDTVAPDFGDPSVQFITVPGTRGHESALLVRSAGGMTLILNDIVGNIRDETGFGGWLLRLAGFAGDVAHIPHVVKIMLIEETEALRSQLMQWSEMTTLKRILVSHGSPIEDHPRQVLRDLADSLR